MLSSSISKMRDLELESESSTNENGTSSDSDVCEDGEICRLFEQADSVCEKEIAKNKYILHMDATSENNPNVAVALSNSCCEVLKLSNQQVAAVTSFREYTNNIIDCKFSKRDQNLIYIGSSNDGISMWDIRTPKKSVINFIDTTVQNGTNKTFSCFDISSNERLVTAGTELFEGDAFLLFWDIRNHELLGGYWESHTNDITQVKFHPNDKDKLISGSIDGLINIYDLSQPCEEDALTDSLNTQSSVDDLLWFDKNRKDNISCVTYTSDLQLWDLDGAEPYKHFSRGDIAREVKKKNEDYTYIAKAHCGVDSLLVLAGSNFKDGECLRSLQIESGLVKPAYNFENNKQRVRSSWFNSNSNILLTGGEKGLLNVWKLKKLK